jgi:pimeloyl-ACP methyl ester carboxylesterase
MRISSLALGAAATVALGALGLVGFTALTARQVEAALPPQGRFIDIDGNHIHYLDVGAGPTILMVHGLGGQMRNFTYGLVDQLKDRFRVVVMERPGSGYSHRARGASARLGVQADVVAAFVRALSLDRPLLVGHSLGGALSLAVALRNPGLLGGLALVSPLTQPQSTAPDAFRGLAISSSLLRGLVAWTLATPLALAGREKVLRQIFSPEPAPDDFALRGGGALGLRPKAFYATSVDLMAVGEDLPGFHARYRTLDLPIAILFGADDRILDPQTHGASMVRQAPNVTYEALEGGGHMIPITRPDDVADFIARAYTRTKAER